MNFRKTAARHPGVKWALGAVEFIVADALLILGISPAWAVAIPLTEKITVDLGNLPNWILALVAAGGFWKAAKAEKKATEAAETSKANSADLGKVQANVELIERNTNSLTKQLETMARKEGKAEGIALGKLRSGEDAELLAAGQTQGRDAERASVAAAGPAPPAATPAATNSLVPGETLAAVAEKNAEKG